MADGAIAELRKAVLHLVHEANEIEAVLSAQQEEIDKLTQLTIQIESAHDLFTRMTAALQEARRLTESAGSHIQQYSTDAQAYVEAL